VSGTIALTNRSAIMGRYALPDRRTQDHNDVGVHPKRPRRSRDEVTRALIDAASTLFSERPSGRVTVREIAARADVNPTLVHRYFGSKQNLMRAAMEQSQRNIASRIDDMDDVQRDIGLLFRELLEQKEFVAVLARASLDGVLPVFPNGYPTMSALVRRIEAQRVGSTAGRPDERVVVAFLASLALGYALFTDFVRRGTGLDSESDDWVEEEIIKLLREVVGTSLDS